MEKKSKQKKKLSQSGLILIISLIIIAIPVVVFAIILLSSSIKTGVPQNGDRYKNDLNPAIKSSAISSVEKEIKALDGVEKCEIVLITSQLRVNIDTVDTLNKQEIKDIADKAYAIVDDQLPVSTYFTSSDACKMYDLTINSYNFVDNSNAMVYYCITKNSNMVEKDSQFVSEPKDPDLVKELTEPDAVDTSDDIDLDAEDENGNE